MCVHQRIFSESPPRAPHDAVAGLDSGHARADRVDNARCFIAADLLRTAVHHASDDELSAVQRARVDFHHHFARFGLRLRDLAPLQGSFVVARNDPVGFHGCSDSLSAAQCAAS
jgi:hypothetical protein